MADIIAGEQQIGGPIRLEERIPVLFTRVVGLVLVGVDQVGRRGLVERADRLEKGVRHQDIIGVQQADELARGQGERGIAVGGDPPVLGQMDDLDPRVPLGQPVQDGAHVRGRGAAIGHAELPPGVGLRHDRVHHQVQVFLRGVIGRDHQADEGLVGKVPPLDPHPGQVRLGWGSPGQPGRVIRIEIPPIGPGMGLQPEGTVQLHRAAVAAPDANDQGVISLDEPLEIDLADEAGVVGVRVFGMCRLDVEACRAVRDPLPGNAVDQDADILDAGLRQGPAPDPQVSGTDGRRIWPGHVAGRQDGARVRGGRRRSRRHRGRGVG